MYVEGKNMIKILIVVFFIGVGVLTPTVDPVNFHTFRDDSGGTNPVIIDQKSATATVMMSASVPENACNTFGWCD